MNSHRQAACLAALLGLALAGCTRPEPGPKAPAKPRVALVLKTLNNPFFIDMQKGAEEAATRLGVDLVVQAAEREVDVDKQMQIIENLIQTGVQALCITPSGSKEVVPAIAKANAAGIPVVIVDTRVDPKAAAEAGIRLDGFVGSDNYEGGKVAGRVPDPGHGRQGQGRRCSRASRATRPATRGSRASTTRSRARPA